MALKKSYQFKLGDEVKMAVSDEAGQVIGRAEYIGDTPRYYVLYKSATGCQSKDWFSAEDLRAVSTSNA